MIGSVDGKDHYAEIDESEPPIVKVKVVRPPTDDNYPDYLHRLGDAFRRQERFGMLFDTGDLHEFPAKYRDMQTAWLKETEEEFRGRWVCSAFVIQHRIIRGVLAVMYWLNPPYFSSKVFTAREGALEWIRGALNR